MFKFKKSLSDLQVQPNFGQILQLIFSESGAEFDINAIPSSVLNVSVNIELIQSALNSLTGRVVITKVYEAILPIIFPSPAADSVWTLVVQSLPRQRSIVVSALKKLLTGKNILSFAHFLRIIADQADVELSLNSIPITILSRSVNIQLAFKSLDSLKGKVALSEICDVIWPAIFETPDENSTNTSVSVTTPSTSYGVFHVIVKMLSKRGRFNLSDLQNALKDKKKMKFRQLLKIVASKVGSSLNLNSVPSSVWSITVDIESIQLALSSMNGEVSASEVFYIIWPIVSESWEESAAPLSDNVWRVMMKSLPIRKLIDVRKIIKSLLGLKNQTFKQILQQIAEVVDINFDLRSVPFSVQNSYVDVRSIRYALHHLKHDVSIVEIFNTIWTTIAGNLDIKSSSPENTWNEIIQSLPYRRTINIARLKKSISNMHSPSFYDLLQLIDIKFSSKRVSSSILDIKFNVRLVLRALESFDNESSIPEIFNAIWPIIFNDWKNSWTKHTTSTTPAPDRFDDVWSIIDKFISRQHKINVQKLKKSINGLKNPNLEQVCHSIIQETSIEFNFRLLPQNIMKSSVDSDCILRALNSFQGEASCPDVFKTILSAIFEDWNSKGTE